MDFSRQKPTCGTCLRRIAAECRGIAAELGNLQPKKNKTDHILPDCVQKKHFQNLPKILEFLPFQKRWHQKWPRGFFSDRWQTRLPMQFPKEIGEMWQWFEMGNRWGGAGTNNAADQERCKVCGWLRLLSRRMHNGPAAIQAKTQEPCKTETAKRFLCCFTRPQLCPEIRAFTGIGGEISSTVSKVLVTVKAYSNTKMAVNSR